MHGRYTENIERIQYTWDPGIPIIKNIIDAW